MVTFPVEQSIVNLPKVEEIRSVSRFGLSVVTVVFQDNVDIYFARQLVSQQLKEAQDQIPDGIGTPELAPVSTGLGEVYQYILHPKEGSEDKYSAMDLRTMQDWIVARQLYGTPGIAEVNSFGGLLNHPYDSVQSLVLESFQWLAVVRSEVVIPALVEYSLRIGDEKAKEVSTYLLKTIAASQPASVWAAIKEHPNQDQIPAIDHMMARIYWQDILTSCRSQDATAASLHQRLVSEFPDGNVTGSDVYLEDHSLIPIEDLLDNLNGMEILNRAFCEGLMENISELSTPLSVIDQLRVERYIRRSFYEEDIEIGHYTYLLRSAVNKSLMGRVGKSQIDEVSTILELPNLL